MDKIFSCKKKVFHRRRKTLGSQIAELGPALILIFLFILFPIFNLIYLAFGWATGWYLNQLEVREATCYANPNGPGSTFAGSSVPAIAVKQSAWSSSGIALLTHSVESSCTVNQIADPNNPQEIGSSEVTSVVVVQPMVKCPFFQNVPGLGSEITFSYDTTQTQEEKGLN